MATNISRTPALIIGLVGILAALALTFGVVGLTRASGNVSVVSGASQLTGIAVCGTGKSTTAPDRATFDVGIFSSASTAAEARSQAATSMAAVIASLKQQGIADADIQTSYFSIQPEYSYNTNQPTLIGYSATNSVSVVAHDVSKVGTIIDSATTAGGNHITINGISFSNGDPAQALSTARASALADAHQQANQIATAAGVTLGSPISIDLNGCGTQSTSPRPIYGAASGASAPTTPIQTGSLQVEVQVAVVYSIH